MPCGAATSVELLPLLDRYHGPEGEPGVGEVRYKKRCSRLCEQTKSMQPTLSMMSWFNDQAW